MNILALQQARRLFYTTQNVAEILNISEASARVLCHRYTKIGFFVRLRKNFYIIKDVISSIERKDLFILSNMLQTPSYVSFLSALAFYGVTTQLLQGVVEAVSISRTKAYSGGGLDFYYSKIKPKLYFGFVREGRFFIATKEKALLDSLYFVSLKRYKFDISSLDLQSFSHSALLKIASKFPLRTRKLLAKLYERSSKT